MAMTVVCDICGDGQTPAMKTCLRCEMSYCFSHFKPHLDNSRLKDHAVVDPTGSLDERLCPEHSEELKFYCTVDSSLVCSSCNIAGEHKGHDVTTLKDEHETRKMYVGEETRAVEEKINEAEKYLKRMYTAHRKAQKSVAGIRGCITSKFARLRKALDEDEREALRRVGVKERDLLSRIEENIACHKGEIAELQAAATRLGTLQLEKDSLTFLQGHLETMRRREIPKESAPPPPTSLDATTISSLERVVNRFLPLVYGCSPTLDTNSAYDLLQISSDLRTVTLNDVPQGRLHHPHRFNYWDQALCSESFSSGQHYWEVDVGNSGWLCRIGVAYATIPRRGRGAECRLGGSDVSWCLQKYGNSFSVLHGGVETSLSVPEPLRRVGVHLDWDAGLLSFYSANSMVLLHSFHQTFAQPLYPGLYVDGLLYGNVGDSVRIVDLSGAS
ncbi:tripartite motif-containing protein 16-like [Lampetra planeri]